MPLQARDLCVLITGGAKRIGRAIACTFAAAGAKVMIHCHRSEHEAEELLQELLDCGSGHGIVCADLCEESERQHLIRDIVKGGFALNCLINNASVYRRLPLLDLDERWLAADYEINFVAPFMLMQSFAKVCGRGSIINLLDQRVGIVDPGAGSYAFAKKSLRDATEAAAVAWAPAIRVNGVAPGLVLPPPGVTPEKMQKLLAAVPMQTHSAPEEVAEACLYLARSRTVTGQILYVDGGLHLANNALKEIAAADYGGG